MSSNSWGNRLYNGDVSYDFVGKQKRWYAISGAILLVSVISLLTLGLKFSLDFRGGSQFTVPTNSVTSQQAQTTTSAFVKDPTAQVQTGIGGRKIVVKTSPLDQPTQAKVREALAKDAGLADTTKVQVDSVSGSWGKEITNKAVQGLVIFVVLVMIYLAIFYEWKMALAAIVALAHDLVITVGVYSLVGFEVSPATVIGFLTILGYSLYDTVVVFDKVKENTKDIGQAGRVSLTFSQAANLAVNQTLIRSLNTSLIALLPVASLLFAGVLVGGAGVLQDLALALLVGIAAGTYSSIFIATPLFADLKEREPDMRELAKKARKSQADARGDRVPVQDRIPAGGAGGRVVETENGASRASVSDVPRGPRNQPVRDRGRNRPSGKKR
jgi:preprotein translocase subunit SecF